MSKKTLVERHGGQIVYRAEATLDIPHLDLLTLLFESKYCGANEQTRIHIDAAEPLRYLTKVEARIFTKRVAYAMRTLYGVGSSFKYDHPQKKDYVTCITAGNYVAPTIFYGVIAAGGILSSVTASANAAELERLIRLAPSELVICSLETKGVAIQAAKACKIPFDRVLLIDAPGRALRRLSDGEDVLTDKQLEWRRITNKEELETTPVCLIYSSGTTGLPKGVPLTHLNMVSAAMLNCDNIRRTMDYRPRTLAHLPVAHIAGMQWYQINPFFMGAETYWMSKFEFIEFLEYNKRYAITFFLTVPPIYVLIAKSPEVKDHFKTVRMAIAGAAPMGRDFQNEVNEKLGDSETTIKQTWGLSETTGSVTILGYDERDDTGSISRLLPNCSARIVDDTGRDVQPEEQGEILVHGPVVFRGYHNNPSANADAFMPAFGDDKYWFKTGDIGLFKNGLLYIVDRKKELIKYKGMQVAPAELEALLLSNPDVLDAAVIGIEGEGTELPRAYVMPKNKGVTETGIQEWVKQRVSTYKQLRGGVVFLDAIPKSASGKILRKDLRTLAKRKPVARL